jgi:hypothetical protein
MEANVRLYAFNYDEVKTYLWAMVFVACNLVLPQVFHLIPQGGAIGHSTTQQKVLFLSWHYG